jgi:hypothetical protein
VTPPPCNRVQGCPNFAVFDNVPKTGGIVSHATYTGRYTSPGYFQAADFGDFYRQPDVTPNPETVQSPAENERAPEQTAVPFREPAESLNELPVLGEAGSSLGVQSPVAAVVAAEFAPGGIVAGPTRPSSEVLRDVVVAEVMSEVFSTGWLRRAIHRRFG